MISPLAHVDPAAKIGTGVTIHPFAYVDADTVIGDNCEIMPYASVIRGTILDKGVKVYQGAIVGADPQDFRWKGGRAVCQVGENTVIRENVIINRGFLTEAGTVVGGESFIFANSHIGHDTHITGKCVIGNNVNIAGSVRIDIGVILSSAVVVHEGSRIGKYSMIKGGTRISSNVPPFVIMAHNPVAYYGVNAVILSKHSIFPPEIIDDIAKAYRHVYKGTTSVYSALKRIEADIDQSEARDEILAFIRESDLKVAGNYFGLDKSK
ncbi:MAG: acyl-ACP--UDP-N-acetylglucosamine O-acyltransferase [Muribaculaceae bacterium]|nr:acyl-ACP--UDP-N-acetylglucosamine O-acyltransferase [Muribaculaceae bacterium]